MLAAVDTINFYLTFQNHAEMLVLGCSGQEFCRRMRFLTFEKYQTPCIVKQDFPFTYLLHFR